ncbi:MAG: FHA domain-containing protein [Candidatus Binataceae bacterium]
MNFEDIVNSLLAPFKEGALNRRELALKALAGLAGGALGWLPVELSSHGHSLTEQLSAGAMVFSYAAISILSGLIGGFIVAAEGQQIEWTPETQKRLIRGFLICAALAVPANYYSNDLFSWFLAAGGWGLGHPGSMFSLVLGRVSSWTLMGAMLGAGVGVATLTMPNIAKGAIGGTAGGFAGGLVFDLINRITGGGLLSRLIGLSGIGLAIGLLIGLVQELTKTAWVTVEQGRLKGRQYRIEGARASIGRAEENPVGLFGDQTVMARHAVIERRGADYVLKNLAVQAGTLVNGSRIESVDLHEGDRINIGGYELIFHLRQGSAPAIAQATLSGDKVSPAQVASRLAGANAPVAGPCLIDDRGQHFPIKPATATTLGRALDNDIVVGHSSVSRHHANIKADHDVFSIEDLNSQNGTFVGGRRIKDATQIRDGDPVRLGEAPFMFRA